MTTSVNTKNRTFIRSRVFALLASVAVVLVLTAIWVALLHHLIPVRNDSTLADALVLYLAYSGAALTVFLLGLVGGSLFGIYAFISVLRAWLKGTASPYTMGSIYTSDGKVDSDDVLMYGLIAFMATALPGIVMLSGLLEYALN